MKRKPKPRRMRSQTIVLNDVSQPSRDAKAQDLLRAFRAQLSEHGCLTEFNALESARCEAERLPYYMIAVGMGFAHHARLKSEPIRMDSKRLRSLVGKTISVARQWGQEFQSPFGKEVMRLAAERDPFAGKDEFLNIPQRLLSLAGCARDIHSKTEHQQRPVYDDALAELCEYVKLKTRRYHDPEVSALVSFATRQDSFSETTLRVWRCGHKDALERARLRLAQR